MRRPRAAEDTFDFVIVGSGSAGSVLANRLSANGAHRVLVLEAGGTDLLPWVQLPIAYGKIYYDARVNWKYMTEPCEGLGGKPSYWPRGKVMGGSSSINAMVYVRGHPGDFDDWADDAPGWGWADVAPVFRRMECWSGGDDGIRGGSGPLHVTDISAEVHPLCHVYLDAAREAQLGTTPDYNGARMEGAAIYQLTTHGGLRASASRCYLRPALRRPNLELRLDAHALRVLVEDGRATGVVYRSGERTTTVRARCEVIVSAGAIASPHLLQLSGIGPGEILARHGVPVVRDAPQVGRNLQDHLGVDHLYRARVPTLNQVLRPWHGKARVAFEYLRRRNGPLALSVNQGGGFFRTDPALERPDIQMYFSPLSYSRAPAGTRPLMQPDPFPGFLLGFSFCRPTSRGHLALRSPDPSVPPEIHPNYLSTERDRADMIRGSRFVRRLAATRALSSVIDEELLPGLHVEDDEGLAAFARDHAWTVFHGCGTCRMGADPARSVVDPRLRVHGIAGLRVVDASVFPSVTSGNTNAPVIMVAERAADMILADQGHAQEAHA